MESIKEFIPYNIKETTVNIIESGSEKAKDLYGKSKEHTIKFREYLKPKIRSYAGYGQDQIVKLRNNLPKWIEYIRYLMQHPTIQRIKQIV